MSAGDTLARNAAIAPATSSTMAVTMEQHRSTSRLLPQPQHPQTSGKTDEIEVLESGVTEDHHNETKITAGWVCCAPCIWLRTSATVHKLLLTTATLLVTSLLVASPVLFLLSTAPSQLPKDCYTQNDLECLPTKAPPVECTMSDCRHIAQNILAQMNWKLNPCNHFKDFSCSMTTVKPLTTSPNYFYPKLTLIDINEMHSMRYRSAQENVDIQMQTLLVYNTTVGPYQKLGRLYHSCLRHTMNSTTIRMFFEQVGGYLPIGALGPSTMMTLLSKIIKYGPTPFVSISYDLSYGKSPQIMLIVDAPVGYGASVIEQSIRWRGPKAATYRIGNNVPPVLDSLMDVFLPNGLSGAQKQSEKDLIVGFVKELNKVYRESIRRDFSDSFVIYNASILTVEYPFLNWTEFIPFNWSGPILLRSTDYLKRIQVLIAKHPNRVIHNALLLLFVLRIIPQTKSIPPDPSVCTKATMWAMPDLASTLYVSQYGDAIVKDVIERTEIVFEVLKAHLKRAPSLKGAALVKLSQLKVQANLWPYFRNTTFITEMMDDVDVNSDNWFSNILKLYQFYYKTTPDMELNPGIVHTAWAYPTVARIFYDTLSHSIVVPLSSVLTPSFNNRLPPYIHYATVGVSIAKEILRSITKQFDWKVMACVPNSLNADTNSSRTDALIQSGGMQISYHSLLSLTGPIKGMTRLPNINLTPPQLFYVIQAQELCANARYDGIDTKLEEFSLLMSWLIGQGGAANAVFHCPYGTQINLQKTCNVL